jgi:transposase
MTHKVNHDAKVVFVGIDVHRHSYKVHAISEEGDRVSFSGNAIPDEVIRGLIRRFPAAEFTTVYEAGFSGFGLHRSLECAGFSSFVVNPAAILKDLSLRNKTDAGDARSMAEQLKAGLLWDKCITVPSKEEEIERLPQRVRGSLVRECVAIRNSFRMRLHYHGYFPLAHRGSLRLVHAKAMLEEVPDAGIRLVLGSILRVWEALNAEIKELDRVIHEQAKVDPLHEIYSSMPGIGTLTGRVLSSELGDMKRFSSGKKVASYAGIVATERSSGETRRLGGISKRGKPQLRFMLTEAAWVAVRKCPEFKELYIRLASRMGGKKAIVAVARKMLLMLRAMLKAKTLFSPELLRKQLNVS